MKTKFDIILTFSYGEKKVEIETVDVFNNTISMKIKFEAKNENGILHSDVQIISEAIELKLNQIYGINRLIPIKDIYEIKHQDNAFFNYYTKTFRLKNTK
ncbi:hypothetical protein [Flavobacterium filum]|uniref:hypothetical protein n=1 Tax=Flavobacterium filum TaxID=370974 RepID=UPI0023EFD7D3|nr:hypothetical protein [Flavobacterium filum]